jgi:Ca2+-binding RTX toxin-like protein
MVLFGDPLTTNPVRLSGGGGDDSIQGGAGNDMLSGGASGGDIVLGMAGNDIIFGGPGEDIINGGPGNDVINAGNSQAGDIADGGSGSDFIHCGMCSGLAVSFHGESGNDFVQGGSSSDLALLGGEGDDWLEGGPGLDILFGDNGIYGNILLGLPSYYGGNDVINPGAGLDTPFGDAGDDIFLLGQGTAAPEGAYGFDWANYEYNQRFDNGATTRPSVWADLGGTINPTTARTGEVLLLIEGLSGSSGNDHLFGGVGRLNQVITGALGAKNTTQLVLPGTLNILPGSHVSGTGIAPNAIVTDFAQVKNGATTSVRLSIANTANIFNGTVTISTEQLRVPALITGISELVTNTPIWTTNGGAWSGGAILLGGEGNDTLYPSDGADVIHGSSYLHTCIGLSSAVTDAGAIAATDVTCGSGRGYSTMSLVARFMDNGVVHPTDIRIVREILSTSTRVTAVAATGTAVTFTADNSFYVGEKISVAGLVAGATNLTAYQPRNAAITAVTPTTFTIASTAPALNSPVTGITAGTAVASDTLDLTGGLTGDPGAVPNPVGGISGPESQFTFTKITGTLPSGATYGCTVTDSVSGNKMYVYDVQMVQFVNSAAKAISTNCGGFDVPSAPAAPVAVAGQTKATITWVAPATNGAPIDYYTIDFFKRGLLGWPNNPTTYSAGTCSGTANNKQVAGNLLTCDVTGLLANDRVRFEVRAHNAAGFSAASPTSNDVTVLSATAKINPVLAWSGISVVPGAAWTLLQPTITSGPTGGTFTYVVTPPSTAVSLIGTSASATASMTPGTATIVATYTPTDLTLYNTATATMTVTVTVVAGAVATPIVGAPGPIGPFTITTSPLASINGNFTAITSVTLGTSGGGTGTVTYSVSPTNRCRIAGSVLTASAVGTCTVTARKATTPTATTATLAVVFILADQAALRITNNSLRTAHTNSFQVTTSGGSGSGAVTYLATPTQGGCAISASGVLTSGTAGSVCSVTVTKAASSLYNAITSTAVIFNFT